MSIETQVGELVSSTTKLMERIEGQADEWDEKVDTKIKEMNDWKEGQIPRMMIGDGGIGSRILNVKQFFNNAATGYIHIVTDIHKSEHRTFCFFIKGQLFYASLALDCCISGYMYGDNGLMFVDSTQDAVSAYVSENGFVSFKITANPYYASLSVDVMRVGNGGFPTITDILVKEDV